MDIEVKLQEIINAYDMRCHDKRKKKKEIYEEIKTILAQHLEGKKVIIRGGGIHTLRLIDDFGSLMNIVGIVDQDVKQTKERVASYKIPVYAPKQLNEIEYDIIVMGIYLKRDVIKKELNDMGVKSVLDIYDELDKKGCSINLPYYEAYKNPYFPIIALNAQYSKETNKDKKGILLEEIIKRYLENRDIWSAQKKISEYILSDYSKKEKYEHLKKALEELINEVKQALECRKEKDIIWFWHDALCYDWVQDMPFMCKCREEGMFFENTFTSSVWTRNVYATIFKKLREIDGYGNQTVDNIITKYVEEKGYRCIRIGGSGSEAQKLAEFDYVNKPLTDYEVATSQYYWQLLRELMQSQQPIFALVHTIYETHVPICSPSLEHYDERVIALENRMTEQGKIAFRNNAKQTVAYLDEMTEGLCEILGERMTKIFMSDHGIAWLSFASRKWTSDSNHFNFIITGENIPRGKHTKLFDLYNFYEVVKYIFEPTEEHFESIFTEEILLQAQDVYSKYLIEYFCALDFAEYGIAFRGVQTLKDRYILLATGKEIYNIMPDEHTNYINKVEYQGRIAELREKAGNHFIDITIEEKFKYTSKLYADINEKSKLG